MAKRNFGFGGFGQHFRRFLHQLWDQLQIMLSMLKKAVRENRFDIIREVLGSAVSGFRPQLGITDTVALALHEQSETRPGFELGEDQPPQRVH